ncbi:MAG: hypothetical protein R3C53_19290 [Pirellulaceae bacterium]
MGTNGRQVGRALETRLELWRERFREFSSGTGTVDQFCKQLGVTAATFYYWRKKLGDCTEARPATARSASGRPSATSLQGGNVAAQSGSFVPVRVASAVASGDVVVRLPSGAQVLIPVSAPELIARVIAQVCERTPQLPSRPCRC